MENLDLKALSDALRNPVREELSESEQIRLTAHYIERVKAEAAEDANLIMNTVRADALLAERGSVFEKMTAEAFIEAAMDLPGDQPRRVLEDMAHWRFVNERLFPCLWPFNREIYKQSCAKLAEMPQPKTAPVTPLPLNRALPRRVSNAG